MGENSDLQVRWKTQMNKHRGEANEGRFKDFEVGADNQSVQEQRRGRKQQQMTTTHKRGNKTARKVRTFTKKVLKTKITNEFFQAVTFCSIRCTLPVAADGMCIHWVKVGRVVHLEMIHYTSLSLLLPCYGLQLENPSWPFTPDIYKALSNRNHLNNK